jgi:hypothetical protein
VPILQDLQQVSALVGGERRQSPVVEDQQLDARQSPEQPIEPTISAGQRQGPSIRKIRAEEEAAASAEATTATPTKSSKGAKK